MKRLFFFAAFSLIVLLFGCDKNSVNNPVSPINADKQAVDIGSVQNGIIHIDKKLINPIGNKNYYQIDGRINYAEELLTNNTVTTVNGYEARLELTISATLKDNSISTNRADIWKISSEKNAVIALPSGETSDFVKSFPVPNNPDGLSLVCTFEVTTRGLLLKNVDLISRRV